MDLVGFAVIFSFLTVFIVYYTYRFQCNVRSNLLCELEQKIDQIEKLEQERDECLRLAITHPLTELPNKHGMEMLTKPLFAKLRRGEVSCVTVVAIDLNLFKQVNDMYGHNEGDQVLKVAGTVLEHCFRGTDIVGHLSGDEFVVVFSGVGEKLVEGVMERASKELRDHSFPFGSVDTSYCYGIASSMSVFVDNRCIQLKGSDTFLGLYDEADKVCNAKKTHR